MRRLRQCEVAESHPKSPYAVHLRILVPKTIPGMVFGTRVLEKAVYGPLRTAWGLGSYLTEGVRKPQGGNVPQCNVLELVDPIGFSVGMRLRGTGD